MKDFNHVVLSGRIANLEKRGEDEKTYLIFDLANHYFSKKGEKWEEKTQFVSCKIFSSKWAESLSKHLEKGIEVCVQGRIVVSDYVDKEEKRKISWYISVTELLFLKKEANEGVEYSDHIEL